MANATYIRVFRALQRDCHELKRQNFANTPQEKLARVQVLFIHLSIQLFDGDVTLRANADRDMPLLQSWLDELSRIRGNLGALARMDDVEIQSAPPQSWEVREPWSRIALTCKASY